MAAVAGEKLTLRFAEEASSQLNYRIRAAGIGGTQAEYHSGYIYDEAHTFLPPGRYTVEVADQKRNWAREHVDINGKSVELSISLRPFPTISGTVQIPGTARIPTGLMFGVSDLEALQMGIGNVEPDGSFSIFATPGHLCPFVSGMAGFYIKEFRPEGGLAADGCVEMGDQGDLRAKVILGTDGGIVKGFVRKDGHGVAGAISILAPAAARKTVKAYMTDSDGSFEFPEVPPGGYTMLAVANGSSLEYANPRVLAPLRTGGVSVKVGPKETVETQSQIHE